MTFSVGGVEDLAHLFFVCILPIPKHPYNNAN